MRFKKASDWLPCDFEEAYFEGTYGKTPICTLQSHPVDFYLSKRCGIYFMQPDEEFNSRSGIVPTRKPYRSGLLKSSGGTAIVCETSSLVITKQQWNVGTLRIICFILRGRNPSINEKGVTIEPTEKLLYVFYRTAAKSKAEEFEFGLVGIECGEDEVKWNPFQSSAQGQDPFRTFFNNLSQPDAAAAAAPVSPPLKRKIKQEEQEYEDISECYKCLRPDVTQEPRPQIMVDVQRYIRPVFRSPQLARASSPIDVDAHQFQDDFMPTFNDFTVPPFQIDPEISYVPETCEPIYQDDSSFDESASAWSTPNSSAASSPDIFSLPDIDSANIRLAEDCDGNLTWQLMDEEFDRTTLFLDDTVMTTCGEWDGMLIPMDMEVMAQ